MKGKMSRVQQDTMIFPGYAKQNIQCIVSLCVDSRGNLVAGYVNLLYMCILIIVHVSGLSVLLISCCVCKIAN